jgi:NDP-sugar pyrophosphorylase family protein
MALVAGKPFLEYLLLQLKKNRITSVTLCVGYRGDLVREYFGNGDSWDLELTYSVEQELLGTAGALKLAEQHLHGEDFLALNGDSLFDVPLHELIAFHQERMAAATLALTRTDCPQRFGTVEIEEQGQVLRFLEKGQGRPGGFVNGGIYVIRRQVLREIPAGRAVSLERKVFPSLVSRGLYGLPFQGYFLDIGVPESLKQAEADAGRLLEIAGRRPGINDNEHATRRGHDL